MLKTSSTVAFRYMVQAGLLDYPQGLYDRIMGWIEDSWDKIRKKLGSGKRGTLQKTFKIDPSDLKDWRYAPDLEKRFPGALDKRKGQVLKVTLTLARDAGGGSSQGQFEIGIGISPYTTFTTVSEVLAHELRHWVQKFLASVLSVELGRPVKPGMPPQKMLDEGVKQKADRDYLETARRHRLDDAEYQTNLGSEVDYLSDIFDVAIERAEAYWEDPEHASSFESDAAKSVREWFPYVRSILRLRMGENVSGLPRNVDHAFRGLGDDIFTITLRHNPEKWKKGVGIFFKKMEPYLQESMWAKALGDPSKNVVEPR